MTYTIRKFQTASCSDDGALIELEVDTVESGLVAMRFDRSQLPDLVMAALCIERASGEQMAKAGRKGTAIALHVDGVGVSPAHDGHHVALTLEFQPGGRLSAALDRETARRVGSALTSWASTSTPPAGAAH